MVIMALFSPSRCGKPCPWPHWSFSACSAHAAFHICLNFLLQKSVLIEVHFGMSWHSIAGSSFASDFSFHGFELTDESCTAKDSKEEDRLLGLNVAGPAKEQ